jgi:Zn-dependent peptidase ImmA (M78 family)
VLAHELGQIVCGHVRLPGDGSRAEMTLSPKTELEADSFAVELLVQSACYPSDRGKVHHIVGGT